jgi:polyketide synthase 2/polyketide synthase 5
MSRIAGAGTMASVELPAPQVLSELMARGIDDVVVAVIASPTSTVIGGVSETVRELVAAWEERDVMAREIAVDVASHSPQVDPILDELADVLAGLNPMAPEVPYYSATLFDPREQLVCDVDYWLDNLRHTVRFGAAVQAALEDGHRVFAELSPHPLLTYAIEQTAASLDMPVAALAGMRREQSMPHGLRDLLAALHGAGAAVDFSVLHPDGRLLDVPLPAWTHRHLLLRSDGHDHQSRAGSSIAVHPLLGSHVRLPEEPERHAWQAEIGTATLPWLTDHQIHEVAALPGAAYCEMALTAARTVLGDVSEVRDIRFEQMLLVDSETPVSALAAVTSPGIADFAVKTFGEDARIRRATAVLHAAEVDEEAPAYNMPALLAAHPCRIEGAELRNRFDEHGVQYGPAFTGLTAAHITEGTARTVLAEVALPGAIRSQQSAYRIHPALLDACFQSLGAAAEAQSAGSGGLLPPMGVRRIRAHASARTAHYCYTRVTNADGSGLEADLDVMDEHGTVLLEMQGLQIGTGASEDANRARLLNERLLTVEWQRRELPEGPEGKAADAGAWLLISISATADIAATQLTDSLKLQSAECTTICWPQRADHAANAELLHDQLGAGRFTAAVVLTGSKNGHPDDECAVRGGEYVSMCRGSPGSWQTFPASRRGCMS